VRGVGEPHLRERMSREVESILYNSLQYGLARS
jgi:hypothetical protein